MGAVNQSDLATQALQSHAGEMPYKGRYVEAAMPQSGGETMFSRALRKVMISALAFVSCLTPEQNFSYP